MPKEKDYCYSHCCVDVGPRAVATLQRMINDARGVTYETVRRHCVGLLSWAEQHGYERHAARGLTLKDDGHVGYYKSRWNGQRCYYVRWSAIEFIWLQQT